MKLKLGSLVYKSSIYKNCTTEKLVEGLQPSMQCILTLQIIKIYLKCFMEYKITMQRFFQLTASL